MKAIVFSEPGGPEVLRLADVPPPALTENRVRVAVEATALNRADLLQRRGKYPPPKGESEILGLECAGIVTEVGAGVSKVKIGDRVMALLAGGGYAEQVVIHERMAMPIPKRLGFEEAAAIPEAFLTAKEALFGVAELRPKERVLVHASAGGVGTAVIQLAKRHGAQVIATSGNGDKLAKARELGADLLINYKQEDFVQVLHERQLSIDVIIDFVGAAYWHKHAECLAPRGRCVVVGLLGGTQATVDFGHLLANRHHIAGMVMRSRTLSDKILMSQRFMDDTLPAFEAGELKPVIDSVLPLAEAGRAHERMEQNRNIGKIVLRVRD